jgi:hypothetical protein
VVASVAANAIRSRCAGLDPGKLAEKALAQGIASL